MDDESEISIEKRRSRTEFFTTSEKKKLAGLVRERELLWNHMNPKYKLNSAIDQAWEEIADEMGKSKNVCKIAYTALRESYRYRVNMAQKRQKNKVKDPLKADDWEYAEDMAFLAKCKRRRAHYLTYKEEDEAENLQQDDTIQSCQRDSDIDSSKLSEKADNVEISNNFDDAMEYNSEVGEPINNEAIITADLVHQLGNLVRAQTEFVEKFQNTQNIQFVFKTQLSACDALLQQLPKTTAERTLIEVQNYILKKINEYKNSLAEIDF